MNQDQVTGIIRAIVPALLAYAAGRGWISESAIPDIVAGIVAVVAALWSIYNNTFGHQIQSISNSPAGIEAAKQTPITPATNAMADALKEPPR